MVRIPDSYQRQELPRFLNRVFGTVRGDIGSRRAHQARIRASTVAHLQQVSARFALRQACPFTMATSPGDYRIVCLFKREKNKDFSPERKSKMLYERLTSTHFFVIPKDPRLKHQSLE